VHGFFANARHLLRPYGETHISHKTGFPYDAWDIAQLAYESSLIMVSKVDFSKKDYPGYNQKRGAGARCDKNFPISGSVTYKFSIERNEDDESTPIHLTVALDLMKLEAVTSTA
jgi:25S rRNA (uracil2634-N3)-methyltransferase